jgi:hypothetical protein
LLHLVGDLFEFHSKYFNETDIYTTELL